MPATTPEPFRGFRPAALTFLRSIKRNNRREWFEENRERYEVDVKRPMQILVEEMDARLGAFAPELVGDPKRSVFRIHRDVRFSKDKSPYKTHVAAWFHHRDAGHTVGTQAVHGGAGLYVHVEPGASMLAGGIWMPPTTALKRLRDEIAEDHESLEAILADRAFRRSFGPLSTEAMLTRTPRGYDPEHPAAELLRRRSFTVSRMLTDDEVLSARLPDTLAKHYERMLPFVRWLNRALGLPAHSRR
jgi:uncharacterized protein (TIGR02453 family)